MTKIILLLASLLISSCAWLKEDLSEDETTQSEAKVETEQTEDVAEVTQASVEPAPMMGGPFVSPPHGRVSEAEPRAKDESWTEELEKPS